jgi:hypothetical protein
MLRRKLLWQDGVAPSNCGVGQAAPGFAEMPPGRGTMHEEQDHHGIRYRVRVLGVRRWRWEVEPPAGVLGLRFQCGELEGEPEDAVRAAKNAIERQTGQFEY